MEAVWLTGFGDPSVLVARETPDPTPAPGQVVVDVEAASITFIETLVRAQKTPWPTSGPNPPYIPGNGVGGVVAGQRIVTTTGGTGGYAGRVAVPSSNLIPIPDGVSTLDATALLADGRTAVGLVEAARVAAGERVLVLAAAGGVGTLIVQLCPGSYVTGAASAGKLDLVRRLGAAEAVDYNSPSWTDGREPFDVVFDSVGGAIGRAALALVKPGGRLLTYGVASGVPTPVDRTDVELIGFTALGVIGQRASEYTARALDLAAQGQLRPVIGQTFPLARAADAHRAVENRETIGKTLLIP